jgi:hypothetical protein
MSYWQIAAGSWGRDYADRFIRHGLAFVGGDLQCDTMEKVKPGDIVVLKRGMSEIVAVGEVVVRDGLCQSYGDKEWLRDFDGWDLPAWCNVDWHVPQANVVTSGLTRATIQKIYRNHLIELANHTIATVPKRTTYDPEPTPTNPITDDDLIGHLINIGLRPGAAEDLTQALRRIRLLANFYLNRPLNLTKEHEARTFLVIPLLIALSWAEQRMRVELPVSGVGRADIACFQQPVRGQNDRCVLLIETKGLEQGLHYAPLQAQRYAQEFPTCDVVVVTHGYCYKAYRREQDRGSFSTQPTAYLNIMQPRDRYPLDPDHVGGAIELVTLILPQ